MTELMLNGQDIAELLQSEGPIVQCVVLRASASSDNNNTTNNNNDLIEQVEVDTTPKKQMVSHILGGPFTFIGQYHDEGLVMMMRRSQDDESLPLNKHKLQPPFDTQEIRGDIVIVKVANEDDDQESDDFFLDFTKKEYLEFAARTDIVAPPEPVEEQEEEDGKPAAVREDNEKDEDSVDDEDSSDSEEDDDNDDEYCLLDDDDEELDEVSMMNLVLGQVLRKFHEEHGRGPDTRELLELRKALAEKFGVEVPDLSGVDFDSKAPVKKRNHNDDDNDTKEEGNNKRVKFDGDATSTTAKDGEESLTETVAS